MTTRSKVGLIFNGNLRCFIQVLLISVKNEH